MIEKLTNYIENQSEESKEKCSAKDSKKTIIDVFMEYLDKLRPKIKSKDRKLRKIYDNLSQKMTKKEKNNLQKKIKKMKKILNQSTEESNDSITAKFSITDFKLEFQETGQNLYNNKTKNSLKSNQIIKKNLKKIILDEKKRMMIVPDKLFYGLPSLFVQSYDFMDSHFLESFNNDIDMCI